MSAISNKAMVGRRYAEEPTTEQPPQGLPDTPSQSNELEATSDSPRIIEPPYNVFGLEEMPNDAIGLRAAIDCIITNVAGFGHEFKSKINVGQKVVIDENGNKQVIHIDRATSLPIDPAVWHDYNAQYDGVDNFFSYCCVDMTFTKMTKMVIGSLETFGNAYVEVLRNPYTRQITTFNMLEDTKTMRLCDKDTEFTPFVQHQIRKTGGPYSSKLVVEKVTRQKRFRRYCQQLTGGNYLGGNISNVYFREFGDPRRMDANTGRYYGPNDTLPTDYKPSTEILHFRIFSTESDYGVPRWLAAVLDVLCIRSSKSVNFNLLKNNTIPPMAIIIEGYDDPTIEQRITDQMNEQIKGEGSRTSALVIQVAGKQVGVGQNAQVIKPEIRLVPLAEILTQEGMFLPLIEASESNIASVFRLPGIILGREAQNLNRATADVAKQLVEEQVFGPMRQEFDEVINIMIMPQLGSTYWQYVSNGPKVDNTELKLKVLDTAHKGGSLTANEERDIIGTMLPDQNLEPISEPQYDKPLSHLQLASRNAATVSNQAQPQPTASGLHELPIDDRVKKALETGLNLGPDKMIHRVMMYHA